MLAPAEPRVDCKRVFMTEAGVSPRVCSDRSAWHWIVPQKRHREAEALGDPARVDTGTAAERRVPAEVCSTEDNVAGLMTKHQATAWVEELLAKFGVRWCTRRLVVASFRG